MLRNVTVKALRDQRRSLLAWACGFVLLVAMYAAVYPSVRDNPDYTRMINELPESYRALIIAGTGGDVTSPAGYLNTELLSLMGPLMMLVYAIGSGANAVAGEEDRGTLELLLAHPVSRTRVVLDKLAALAAGVALLTVVLWLAVWVGGRAAGMAIGAGDTAAAMVSLGLLGVEFGALALALGCLTGRPGLAKAVAGLVAVAAYLVHSLAPLVDWLEPLRKLSPFYSYIGHDPLLHGFAVGAAGVLALSGLALAGLAVAAFRRRDVLV